MAHSDNPVISVVGRKTGREVADVCGKIIAIDEDFLACIIGIVTKMCENHVCAIERNNHGHTLIAFVNNDGNVRLYQQEEVDSITGKIAKNICWNTDHKSKANTINTLNDYLNDGPWIPKNIETNDELRTFVHDKRGAIVDMKGSHYDRVMAQSLASWGRRKTVAESHFGVEWCSRRCSIVCRRL